MNSESTRKKENTQNPVKMHLPKVEKHSETLGIARTELRIAQNEGTLAQKSLNKTQEPADGTTQNALEIAQNESRNTQPHSE
jgi:hypothetical protein